MMKKTILLSVLAAVCTYAMVATAYGLYARDSAIRGWSAASKTPLGDPKTDEVDAAIVRRDATLPMQGDIDPVAAEIAVRNFVYSNLIVGYERSPGAPAGRKYAYLGTPSATMQCGGTAQAYSWAMNAIGVPARLVQLAGKDFLAGADKYQTHVTVEVQIDGHWEISDPYFNAFFHCGDDAKRLSVTEAMACVRAGKTLTPEVGTATNPRAEKISTTKTPYPEYLGAYIRRSSPTTNSPEESYPREGWLKDALVQYDAVD